MGRSVGRSIERSVGRSVDRSVGKKRGENSEVVREILPGLIRPGSNTSYNFHFAYRGGAPPQDNVAIEADFGEQHDKKKMRGAQAPENTLSRDKSFIRIPFSHTPP